MYRLPLTFAHFLCTAENRSAFLAVQELAGSLAADQPYPANPLLLHGPAGTGKTHLISALAEQVTRSRPELAVLHLNAGAFTQTNFAIEEVHPPSSPRGEGESGSLFALARDADLLLVEDIQHLHASAVGSFTELVDHLLANGQQLVLTASAGPQQLRLGQRRFPPRLINRLAGGMVVSLQPLREPGRLALLREHTKHLNIIEEVLRWLARNLPGGVRQLLGVVQQLEALAKSNETLDLETVSRLFQTQADSTKITVEHITRQVSRFFCVEPAQLRSRRRWQNIVLPRQVGMYLARQLTGLSLVQIGEYFGGRDHATVLHACRKVEEALGKDVTLSGAIRQLQTELSN